MVYSNTKSIQLYNMDLATAYGRVLKKHRKSASLSQEELAHRSKMHTGAISFLERGLRKPTLYTVFAISKVLNTKPHQMIEEVYALNPEVETESFWDNLSS